MKLRILLEQFKALSRLLELFDKKMVLATFVTFVVFGCGMWIKMYFVEKTPLGCPEFHH